MNRSLENNLAKLLVFCVTIFVTISSGYAKIDGKGSEAEEIKVEGAEGPGPSCMC